jgi:hypothetical protein
VSAVTFERQSEADAYTYLHTQGVEAFDAEYRGFASPLLNHWADKGLVHISFPDGALTVRTYKKYSRMTVPQVKMNRDR